jgi:hypothetical protein
MLRLSPQNLTTHLHKKKFFTALKTSKKRLFQSQKSAVIGSQPSADGLSIGSLQLFIFGKNIKAMMSLSSTVNGEKSY